MPKPAVCDYNIVKSSITLNFKGTAVNPKPELLAPPVISNHFLPLSKAVRRGISGPEKVQARASASNFTLDELATLIPFAHKRGVRIYTAFNSQIVSAEIPEVLDTLNGLSSLKPDGLIVQDAGDFSSCPALVSRF